MISEETDLTKVITKIHNMTSDSMSEVFVILGGHDRNFIDPNDNGNNHIQRCISRDQPFVNQFSFGEYILSITSEF